MKDFKEKLSKVALNESWIIIRVKDTNQSIIDRVSDLM